MESHITSPSTPPPMETPNASHPQDISAGNLVSSPTQSEVPPKASSGAKATAQPSITPRRFGKFFRLESSQQGSGPRLRSSLEDEISRMPNPTKRRKITHEGTAVNTGRASPTSEPFEGFAVGNNLDAPMNVDAARAIAIKSSVSTSEHIPVNRLVGAVNNDRDHQHESDNAAVGAAVSESLPPLDGSSNSLGNDLDLFPNSNLDESGVSNLLATVDSPLIEDDIDSESTSGDLDTAAPLEGQATCNSTKSTFPARISRMEDRPIDTTSLLRRATGRPLRTYHRIRSEAYSDWQTETTNFYNNVEDVNQCDSLLHKYEHVVPFAVAATHDQSLVAVGDEEGYVRILDSTVESSDDTSPWSKNVVNFQPHHNSIMDLTFSDDDSLLATASGDKSCKIIDVTTQNPVWQLNGHDLTVRQIKFNPTETDLVATSSRDGTIRIWDLRCKAAGEYEISTNQDSVLDVRARVKVGCASHVINEKWSKDSAPEFDTEAPRRIPDCKRSLAKTYDANLSVTSLLYIPMISSHLIVSASSANSTIKVWDTRKGVGSAEPLSIAAAPTHHESSRQWGVTSMALSGDGSRLYALSKDDSIYAYSTQHLFLGSTPNFSTQAKTRSSIGTSNREGLGPLYCFRHSGLAVKTFYVKLALRPAVGDKCEMLASGSSMGNSLVFPTNERYMDTPGVPCGEDCTSPMSSTLPTYSRGTRLCGCLSYNADEVTSVAWTSRGDLVTAADDRTVKLWREGTIARSLRLGAAVDELAEEQEEWGCAEARDRFDHLDDILDVVSHDPNERFHASYYWRQRMDSRLLTMSLERANAVEYFEQTGFRQQILDDEESIDPDNSDADHEDSDHDCRACGCDRVWDQIEAEERYEDLHGRNPDIYGSEYSLESLDKGNRFDRDEETGSEASGN